MAEEIKIKEDNKETSKQEAPKKEIKKPKQETFKLVSSKLKFVYMTEKAIRDIELQNKLVFIVDRSATKAEIKKEVEEGYKEKVSKIRTMIDQKGRKKAMVKFQKDNVAGDIAVKLGII